MKFKLEGFPHLGEYINLPSLGELLESPFFNYTDLDVAYKYGGEITKHLIGKTPLTNKFKYTTIICHVQYLTPDFSPLKSIVTPRNDWHCDGQIGVNEDLFYLLLNDTECNTEFNENSGIEIEHESNLTVPELNRILNFKEVGLVPKRLIGNRIATFNSRNAHRTVNVLKPAFRYMWRVRESNYIAPVNFDINAVRTSYVHKYNKSFPSIVQEKKGIRIYT